MRMIRRPSSLASAPLWRLPCKEKRATIPPLVAGCISPPVARQLFVTRGPIRAPLHDIGGRLNVYSDSARMTGNNHPNRRTGEKK